MEWLMELEWYWWLVIWMVFLVCAVPVIGGYCSMTWDKDTKPPHWK